MLDLVASRRANVERIIKESSTSLIEEFAAADRVWTRILNAKREEITAEIHAANFRFFGNRRAMEDAFLGVTWPVLHEVTRAQTPDVPAVNRRTPVEDMVQLADQFLNHCRRHANRLSLTVDATL